MANNTSGASPGVEAVDISPQGFQNSGFIEGSGVQALQQEAQNYKIDEASLRSQAEAQYKATFDAEQHSLSTQLSALIKAQTEDTDLLNRQYQQSINTMMSKLSRRGLATGATPQATTTALNRFKNEVMGQRQALYNTQREGVQAAIDTSKSNYELGVRARMYNIRNNSLRSLNDLMLQMAQLQSSSFEAYVNYMLSKRKASIDATSVQLARDRLGMDAQSIELDKQKIGLESSALELARKRVGLEAKSIGYDRDRLKLQQQSIALDKKRIGLDAEAIERDRERIGLEAESIENDRKNIDIQYGVGKSSGSGSRRRSSYGGSTAVVTPTPEPDEDMEVYFAGPGTTTPSKPASSTPTNIWMGGRMAPNRQQPIEQTS